MSHVVGSATHRLEGLRVVVDCAHGAANVRIGKRCDGWEPTSSPRSPSRNGLNINDGCGSTHIDRLRELVTEHRADAGIAVDGDADRCLGVSRRRRADRRRPDSRCPRARDGRTPRAARGQLVATVMSNEGFRLAMRAAGLAVVDTAVGDRCGLEAMKIGGYSRAVSSRVT